MDATTATARLEELRAVIRAECISYGELAELADLVPYIDPGDVELLQWAGVPEHADETDHEPYNRAIIYARELGAEHGRAAASWVFDGNTTDETYARILQGMEDGDPEILDTLPAPDLSGQWADSLTGPQLVEDARAEIGLPHAERHDLYAESYRENCAACRLTSDSFSDICDAYETAYGEAVEAELGRVARLQIEAE